MDHSQSEYIINLKNLNLNPIRNKFRSVIINFDWLNSHIVGIWTHHCFMNCGKNCKLSPFTFFPQYIWNSIPKLSPSIVLFPKIPSTINSLSLRKLCQMYINAISTYKLLFLTRCMLKLVVVHCEQVWFLPTHSPKNQWWGCLASPMGVTTGRSQIFHMQYMLLQAY